MRKLLFCAVVILLGSLSAYSQVILDFANLANGVNASIADDTGTNKLAGSVYLADLFYAEDANGVPIGLNSMTDAGLAQPFLTGAAAGYFADPTAVTLNATGQIEFEVVVWQSAAGSTWAAATGGGVGNGLTYIGNGGTEIGFSNPFLLTPNTSPFPPSPLIGLTSFNLVPVPEPATLAIGGLGAAALMFFRRRQRAKIRQI